MKGLGGGKVELPEQRNTLEMLPLALLAVQVHQQCCVVYSLCAYAVLMSGFVLKRLDYS